MTKDLLNLPNNQLKENFILMQCSETCLRSCQLAMVKVEVLIHLFLVARLIHTSLSKLEGNNNLNNKFQNID